MTASIHPFPPRPRAVEPQADCGCCEICGDEVEAEDLSVEAFETCGYRIVCGGCFEETAAKWDEDNSQFGMGA